MLLGNTSNATPGNLSAATTGQTYLTTKAYVKPSTGEIHAGGYIIDGKAATDLLNATGGVTSISSISTTDEKVKQENDTAANYRPLLLGANNNAAVGSIPTTTVTGTSYMNKSIYAQPSTGELGATQMKVGGHVTLQYNSSTESLDFIFS